jgi:hypothetical protein
LTPDDLGPGIARRLARPVAAPAVDDDHLNVLLAANITDEPADPIRFVQCRDDNRYLFHVITIL